MKLKSCLFVAFSLGLVASCGKNSNNSQPSNDVLNSFEGSWVDKYNRPVFTIDKVGEVNIPENIDVDYIMTYNSTSFSCKTVAVNSKMTCGDFLLETNGTTVEMVENQGQGHVLNYFKAGHVSNNPFLGVWNCASENGGDIFSLSIAELKDKYTFVQHIKGQSNFNYYLSRDITVKNDTETSKKMFDGSSEILTHIAEGRKDAVGNSLVGKTPFEIKSENVTCIPASDSVPARFR